MLSVLVCVMPYFVATNRIPRRGYDIAVRSYHLLLVLLARRHEHVIIGFHLGGCLKLISQHILDTEGTASSVRVVNLAVESNPSRGPPQRASSGGRYCSLVCLPRLNCNFYSSLHGRPKRRGPF